MILLAENLVKSYKTKTVVKGISIEVRSGEIVGLLGPNGSGKSTTFNMIMGFIRPDKGKIFLNSKDITNYPVYARAKSGLGYLAQEPTIFRDLTVEDNIRIALEAIIDDENKIKAKIDEVLKEFSIEHLKFRKASTLSGGEKRRVEVARVLSLNPSIILLDEPFVGIDPITVSDLKKIITHLAKKNIGILISDHNVRETLEITNRAYIIYQGEIITFGTPNDIVNSEKAKRFYLGYDFEM